MALLMEWTAKVFLSDPSSRDVRSLSMLISMFLTTDPSRWRSARLMRVAVARQVAGVGGMTVSNRRAPVRRNHFDIEVDHPLAADIPAGGAHPVPSMAGRTGEPVVNMPCMLSEACVRDYPRQV